MSNSLFSSLFELLEKHSQHQVALVTSNLRLAQELRQQYDLYQSAKGKPAWPEVRSITFSQWVDIAWQSCLDRAVFMPELRRYLDQYSDYKVLSKKQSVILWQQIIEKHTEDPLLNTESAVNLAMDAYDRYHGWQLQEPEVLTYANPDTDLFLHWLHFFEQELKQQSWLTSVQQLKVLTQCLTQSGHVGFEHVLLYGFDTFTPLQGEFLTNTMESGCDVHFCDEQLLAEHPINQPTVHAFHDEKQEWQSAAKWALEQTENHHSNRIAIVIPGIEQKRTEVERSISQVITPWSRYQAAPFNHRPYFNISIGKPLNQYGLIRAAVLLIKASLLPLSLAEWRFLLLCPDILDAKSEREDRAELDVRLWQKGIEAFDLKSFVNAIQSMGKRKTLPDGSEDEMQVLAPRLQNVFKELFELQNCFSNQKDVTLTSCVEHWLHFLNLFEWAQQRTSSSDVFQLLEKWQGVLAEFQQLNSVLTNPTVTEAFSQLDRLLSETLFQPQSESDRIHILGTLEAAGQRFDALWLTGMTDEAWPVRSNPNPYIPFQLQRSYAMPRSTAERELEMAQRIQHRFQVTVPELIFSYPQWEQDKPLAPSPLIKIFETQAFQGEPASTSVSLQYKAQRYDKSIPLQEHEASTGGSGLLKDQGDCPFKAFAKYRLLAQPLPGVISGVSPAERGNMVHELLEVFWHFCKDSKTLLQLSEPDINAHLSESASKIVRAVLGDRFHEWPKWLCLEQEQLVQLIKVWLQQEKLRNPFRVLTLEQWRKVELEGLNLNVRIDRMDELEDGGYLLIDYKTGSVSNQGWLNEELSEPQLPLYCLAEGDKVRAIAFAQVRYDNSAFIGVTDSQTKLYEEEKKKIHQQEDWQYLVQQWRSELSRLATSFKQGQATVTPRNRATSCQYCDLPTFCRISEQHSDVSLYSHQEDSNTTWEGA